MNKEQKIKRIIDLIAIKENAEVEEKQLRLELLTEIEQTEKINNYTVSKTQKQNYKLKEGVDIEFLKEKYPNCVEEIVQENVTEDGLKFLKKEYPTLVEIKIIPNVNCGELYKVAEEDVVEKSTTEYLTFKKGKEKENF